MRDNKPIISRCIGLFLLGCFLFSFPVLTIFNLEKSVFGVPLFFFYLFCAWSVLIACILLCGKVPGPVQASKLKGGENTVKPPG